jgi:hypothetical protein
LNYVKLLTRGATHRHQYVRAMCRPGEHLPTTGPQQMRWVIGPTSGFNRREIC